MGHAEKKKKKLIVSCNWLLLTFSAIISSLRISREHSLCVTINFSDLQNFDPPGPEQQKIK